MSFAKIAEARAVKKIVIMLRQMADDGHPVDPASDVTYGGALLSAADDIEAGKWKDIKLPTPKKKKAKKR